MKKNKVVALGIDFNDNLLKVWSIFREMNDFASFDLHLIHAASTVDPFLVASLNLALIPSTEHRLLIEYSIKEKLKEISREILPLNHVGQVTYSCLLSSRPKKAFLDYVTEIGADLIVLASSKNRRFSFGSFIHYQTLSSKSDVLVLRGVT